MTKAKDLVGYTWGRLRVVRFVGSFGEPYKKRRVWECVCTCGNKVELAVGTITGGIQKSCGCWRSEVTTKRSLKHGQGRKGRRTKTYTTWHGLFKRCYNPNERGYKNYGARGIKVSDSWYIFENFYADMGDRPKGMTLERIDNDGDYCKSNCRWATWNDQIRNRRPPYTNKLDMTKATMIRRILKKGQMNQREVAELFGVTSSLISSVKLWKIWRD